MNRMMRIIAAGLALSVAFLSPRLLAGDNLIENGDFETVGSFTNDNGNWEYLSNITEGLANWTTSDNVGVSKSSGTWIKTGINVGTYALYIQSNDSTRYAYQDVTIDSPGDYRIEFDYAPRPSHEDQQVSVYFGKVTDGSDVTESDLLNSFYSRYADQFTHYTRRVTVTEAGTYRFKLCVTSSSDQATAFDNVIVSKIDDPVNKPDTYLSYVQSDENQSIDVGLMPRADMRVEADIDFIGGTHAMGLNHYESYMIANNDGYISGRLLKSGFATTDVALNTGRHIVTGDGPYGGNYVMCVDGGSEYYSTGNVTARGAGVNFTVFKGMNGSAASMKLYGLKIYMNGYLVRDYVPGSKDGVAGLYDKEHDVWYAPSGTLTEGPAIADEAVLQTSASIANGSVVVMSDVAGAEGTEANGHYLVTGTHTFTAPSEGCEVNGVKYGCVGYRVERYNFSEGSATDSLTLVGDYTGRSFAYTNTAAMTAVRLTWKWSEMTCEINGTQYASVMEALASGTASADYPITLISATDEAITVAAGTTLYFSNDGYSFTGSVTLEGDNAKFVNKGDALAVGTVVAAAGYHLTEAEGTYTVVKTAVEIGGTPYATFDAALEAEAIVSGSTMKLWQNLDLTSRGPVTFLNGVNIDCNGYTFTAYSSLEYIESTGSQYIDSGIKGPANSSENFIEVDADLDWISGEIMVGHSHDEFWPLGSKNSDDAICGSLKSVGAESGVAKNTGRHEVVAKATIGGTFDLTVDGNKTVSTGTVSGKDSWSGRQMYIFAQYGSGAENHSSAKLYGMTIKVNDDVKGKFVPCLQITESNAAGTVGLWNDITKSFAASGSTTELVAGPALRAGAMLVNADAKIADPITKADIAWNDAVDKVISGKIVNGCVIVESNIPGPEAGQAFGTYYVNQDATFTASTDDQEIDGVTFKFAGYTLERYTFVGESATLTAVGDFETGSFAYTNTAANSAVKLTWKWTTDAVCTIGEQGYATIADAVTNGTTTADTPAVLLVNSVEQVEIPSDTIFYFSSGERTFSGKFILKAGATLVNCDNELADGCVTTVPGYRVFQSENTYMTEVTAAYVNGTAYATMNDAIKALASGSTLLLNDNIDLTSLGPITSLDGVSINCNGYTFTGYMPLEYVESTAKQWVDIGLPVTNMQFDVDVDWISGNRMIGQNHYDLIPLLNIDNCIGGNYWGSGKVSTGVALNTGRHTVQSKYVRNDSNAGTLYMSVDNGETVSIQGTRNDVTPKSMYLFAAHSGEGVGAIDNQCSSKLYGLKISTNGLLRADYVPCLKITESRSDGIAGLWNDVAKTFSASGSGTELVAGPVVRTGATLVNADAKIATPITTADTAWNDTVDKIVAGKIVNGCVVVTSNVFSPEANQAFGTYYVNDGFTFTAPTTNQIINNVEYRFVGYKVERYNFSAGNVTETLTAVAASETEGSYNYINSAALTAVKITWQWECYVCMIGENKYISIAKALEANSATDDNPVTLCANTTEDVTVSAGKTLYFSQGDFTFSGSVTLSGAGAKFVNCGSDLSGVSIIAGPGCRIKQDDNIYTAVATAVYVGETPYATFDAAIEAGVLVPGSTLKLNDNIDLTSRGPVTFLNGVTIDYNGYTFAAYKALEYVEATGSQWVNIGLPTDYIKFDVDADWISGNRLLGQNHYTLFPLLNNDGYIGGDYWNAKVTSTDVALNTGRHGMLSQYKDQTLTITIDGGNEYSSSGTRTVNPYDMYLFAAHSGPNDGSIDGGYCEAKLYRLKIYRSDSLSGDYIPCLYITDTNTSGTVGLWDDVNDAFCTSGTTTELVAGPEIRTGATLMNSDAKIRVVTKADTAWNSTVDKVVGGKIVNGCVVTASKFPIDEYASEMFVSTNYVNTVHTFAPTNIVMDGVEYACRGYSVERYNFAKGEVTDTLTVTKRSGNVYTYTNNPAQTAVKITWEWKEYNPPFIIRIR